ncbi:MAG TPA: hypothetical protein VH257_14690, partial [Chloroflexota bacterium]|nr:hypothetical protein [Chloroflexota bacterium]
MTRPRLSSPGRPESTTGNGNGRYLPATALSVAAPSSDASPNPRVPAPARPWQGRLVPATLPAGLAGAALSATVLGIALAFVAWPWVRPDLLWNDIADAPNHLVRIFAVGAALGRGEAYPRWLGDLYLGYGYPLLNYYAPGLYYLGAA